MRPTESPTGTPIFDSEAYDFVFETALAISREIEDDGEPGISQPTVEMLFGIINLWEKNGAVDAPMVQAAYDFCAAYRAELDILGEAIKDGKIVAVSK